MNDIHTERSATGRIPIVSPTLHFIAMPALVFLRSSFGFVFLRPKSVFFAFSWAFILFAVFAWNNPFRWREYRAICLFGVAAIGLYWFHLLLTVIRDIREKGVHDHYSGTSHALAVIAPFGVSKEYAERRLHIWIEPALIVLIAAVLRAGFSERYLSTWLVVVALCLGCAEFMNYWYGEVRRKKVLTDIEGDMARQGQSVSEDKTTVAAPKPARIEPVKMPRNIASAEEARSEERFAKLLQLRTPYTLEEAEDHYRALAKLEHPKTNENSPEGNAAMVEINEAIAFIRNRLGG